jgi:Glutathione S-transferase, C-terminal domain
MCLWTTSHTADVVEALLTFSLVFAHTQAVAALEAHLAGRTFLCGQRMTIADVCVAAGLDGVTLAPETHVSLACVQVLL